MDGNVGTSHKSIINNDHAGGKHEGRGPAGAARLTVGLQVLAQLRLGLAVGPVGGLVGQPGRHGGGGDHGLEGALPLLDVELRVEDDDVDLGDVEQAEGDGGAQVHGDGEGGGLDVELGTESTRLTRHRNGPVPAGQNRLDGTRRNRLDGFYGEGLFLSPCVFLTSRIWF